MSLSPEVTGQSPSNWPWYRKPEVWTGIIVPILLAVGGFWLWGLVGAFVVAALQNALLAAVLGAALVGFVAMLMSKEFRVGLVTAYRMFMWNLTMGLVKMDPLAYLRTKQKELQQREVNVRRGYGSIHGKREGLERHISEKEEERAELMQQAQIAQRKGLTEDYAVLADRIQLLDKNLVSYKNWLAVLQRLELILDKIRQVVSFSLRTTTNRIDAAEEAKKVADSSHRTMLEAMQIIGVEANDQMAAVAFRALRDDYEAKMGDIAAMTRDAADIVSSFDMGRAVAVEQLDAKLAALTSKADKLMLSAPGQIRTAAPVTPVTAGVPSGSYITLGSDPSKK